MGIAILGSTNQLNEKLSHPHPFIIASRPRPGFSIHFHAVPVTIRDKAIGYRYIVRITPSARIFWSNKIANKRPRSIEINMNKNPKINKFENATSQRGDSNNLSY